MIVQNNNGGNQYSHSMNHCLEFFSKAGSLMDGGRDYYGNREDIVKLFENAIAADVNTAIKLLFWVRDPRGGAGNRSGFRKCLRYLAKTIPGCIEDKLHFVPEFGRWDDLRILFDTELKERAVVLWANAIAAQHQLACKWAKRTDHDIYVFLKKQGNIKNIGDFRRLLSKGRKGVVEQFMCAKEWSEINYEHVPSVAMSRYNKAFERNDQERYSKFIGDVEGGNAKVNASTLFPHDCIRALKSGSNEAAVRNQWKALPDYMAKDQRIMPIVDTSGSMSVAASGSISCMDVAMSLGLYCSERVGEDNPFYKKFIQFCDESKLTSWDHLEFSVNLFQCSGLFKGAVGSTRIEVALNMLLNNGRMFDVPKDKMPNTLLILSDMQFNQGVQSSSGGGAVVENCLGLWEKYGYDRPKILYWNLNGYAGQPSTAYKDNVGLISGFSPAILKAVFNGESFAPMDIMKKALEKYDITIDK